MSTSTEIDRVIKGFYCNSKSFQIMVWHQTGDKSLPEPVMGLRHCMVSLDHNELTC